jgi:hypothetical protein
VAGGVHLCYGHFALPLSIFLAFLSIGPDVTDYISALFRSHRLSEAAVKRCSDGDGYAKALKRLNIQIGDG